MINITDLQNGDSAGVSDWITVTQEMINAFAEATQDFNWIHIDQQRCQTESPFGTTIAHGFLSATLMPSQFYQLIEVDLNRFTLLNYGVDKLRFMEPVRCDDQIRYRIRLIERRTKATGEVFKFECKVERAGSDKPVMLGVYLLFLVPREQ